MSRSSGETKAENYLRLARHCDVMAARQRLLAQELEQQAALWRTRAERWDKTVVELPQEIDEKS